MRGPATELTAHERKELYLLLLSSNRCNIAETCAALGVSRTWYDKWLHQDPVFKRRVIEIQEARIDFAEDKLLQNVEGLVSSDIKFFLQTQGKHRGYGKETKIIGDPSAPIGVAVSGTMGLHVSYPEAPSSIADWEKQVEDAKVARAARALEAAKDPEVVARELLSRIQDLEAEEDASHGIEVQ